MTEYMLMGCENVGENGVPGVRHDGGEVGNGA